MIFPISKSPFGGGWLPGSTRKTPKKGTPKKPVMATTPTRKSVNHPEEVRVIVSFGEETSEVAKSNDPVQLVDEVMGKAKKEATEVDREEDGEEEEDNMTLQDFLEMINISFLDDLNATKHRRHTAFIPASQRLSSASSTDEVASLADRIIAGANTSNMLALLRFACNALKQYIQDGRDVIKEIDDDACEDNPLLFKEYVDAPTELRAVMDSQFKNIKTHARLEAKGVWYDWRRTLIDNIMEKLLPISDGLQKDVKTVENGVAVLNSVMPELVKNWEKTKREFDKIEKLKQRIEKDDPQKLQEAREKLPALFNTIINMRQEGAKKREEAKKIDAEIREKEAQKAQLIASIEEAERIQEMNRSLNEDDIKSWRSRCNDLEKDSGWSISKVLSDGRLELLFRRELRVQCDPNGRSVPSVEYVPPTNKKVSQCKPLPAVEYSFFVSGLNSLLENERSPKTVLKTVSNYWAQAKQILKNIQCLRKTHYTEASIGDNGALIIKAIVLVPLLKSKMIVEYGIQSGDLVPNEPCVTIAYGAISQPAVQGLLKERPGMWSENVAEAVQRCLNDRRRGGAVSAKS